MCSIQMLVIMTGEEAELNLALDASSLDEGTHTLKMTFWNSFGGSVSDDGGADYQDIHVSFVAIRGHSRYAVGKMSFSLFYIVFF